MNFNKENLYNVLAEVLNSRDIKLEDIPDMYLYMDQVTTLFESKLTSSKRTTHDKIMTSTMINNYAKAKIFPATKNKKYNKSQIIFLDLIYNLKQNLSLTDIGNVLFPLIEDIKSEEKTLPEIDNLYSAFLELKQTELEKFENYFKEIEASVSEKVANLEGSNNPQTEMILLVLMLIVHANTEKRMAEKIIDNFFNKTEKAENSSFTVMN